MTDFIKKHKPSSIAAMVLSQAHFKRSYPDATASAFNVYGPLPPDYFVSSSNADDNAVMIEHQAVVPIAAFLGSAMSEDTCQQVLSILDDALKRVFTNDNGGGSADVGAIARMVDNKDIVIKYRGNKPFPTQQILTIISILGKERAIGDMPLNVLHRGDNLDPVVRNLVEERYMQTLLDKVSKLNIEEEW